MRLVKKNFGKNRLEEDIISLIFSANKNLDNGNPAAAIYLLEDAQILYGFSRRSKDVEDCIDETLSRYRDTRNWQYQSKSF